MMLPLADLLLTPDDMAAVDRAAALSGIDSYGLMEKAGQAVAAAALRHFPGALRYIVLCGPGNNGGDGYVAAGALWQAGASVQLFHLGDPMRLKGDAACALADCPVAGAAVGDYVPKAGDVVIDAIFGAGLSRPIPTEVAAVIARIGEAGIPVIAVDLPSGLDGGSGQILGAAFRAARTVTFMTRKPGHLLLPGRDLCGEVEVFDIGIPGRIVRAHADGLIAENTPAQWQAKIPSEGTETHKYKRGHLVVFSGGPNATGAARMSAMAGLKAGAGLVTIASPPDALSINAGLLTAIMLHPVDDEAALRTWLADQRLSTFILGPGFGAGERARQFCLALADRHLVLDADGITSFRDNPQRLFDAFAEGPTRLVLTPHEGEFGRLFPDIAADETLSKIDKARAAAARAHAAIIYKGADSVIAAPDGRTLINANAPPWLATAGSGDVLAGIVGGLMAQGMPAFEAAAAGVWLHGLAGQHAGKGLTAEDLVAAVKPL
ncbi:MULTISPECIES: bifunctional ADP-dependent NAD(P)H-hydrate dehydratase/NAD(P)H-hydrate epimerase [unclassified Rhizobium]|uniref:bifunctional ADP-dependent NAD(P)H-hydrate dehydratase/NAD(P)H-hydrate epimerase n=1 Tax=unclassified Rhizobium TaxID=2613769 RepID=UPI0006491A44|nr:MULTISPECIES: bifunctional ADP-dependent NAD(P)H-hydrate dehydratase/NAD(P)H-hydrate epimerase [unclassified Rhizobium]MBN8952057.1 bifunctional ADP-dependent NAD(P)H-hydrate dehydratase/NAD(P)H-hydrate epimerase [Rhizobium tropici]OJY77994.1 MAG: bifunctional ADP-dependent (S)-NAD(P)H-hydrate dehydratase/NAD(P)H-hydrate epimerase [Rhizobium sp. 60-20]RKD56694.1 NAD(P)H-hydrate epimerase [Rhizobium sp. WW_1]